VSSVLNPAEIRLQPKFRPHPPIPILAPSPPHHFPYKNIQRHPRLLAREILRRTADWQRLQKQSHRHLGNFA
jgi:hypothetical protein